LVSIPSRIEIAVVKRHIPTKTVPTIIKSPWPLIRRNIKNIINETKIAKRKCRFVKIAGTGLLRLTFDITISRKAPLGQKFQHQNLPLKKANTEKKAAIAATR